jgi:hypothetical protein
MVVRNRHSQQSYKDSPMTRVPASLIAAAAVLALAACADSAAKISAPAALQPSLSQSTELNTGYKKIMKVKAEGEADTKQAAKDMADAEKNAARTSRHTTGTGINYHGGPILVTTNVAAIYWATAPIYAGGPAAGSFSTVNSGDASLVGDFLRGLGGSPYFNINTTYYNGSNTHVQNVVTYTQYWANSTVLVPANNGSTTKVTDGTMLAMLQSGIAGGNLVYEPNTLYAIFTPGKVNLGGGFGTQYCAYHGSGTVLVGGVSKTILYAAMPYNYAYPSGCTSGYPTADADKGASYEVNTLAHEIEETTTDGFGNAWWDSRGYENADKCAWTWGTIYTTNGGWWNMNVGGHYVLVQQNWKNVAGGGCALHL